MFVKKKYFMNGICLFKALLLIEIATAIMGPCAFRGQKLLIMDPL